MEASSVQSGAESAATRCDQGGSEIERLVVRYRESDVAEFQLFICRANARVVVFLDTNEGGRIKVVDENGADEIGLVLPPFQPGSYTLTWHLIGVGDDWQTRAEFRVNGVAQFRLRKDSATSEFPFDRGFLFLEVLS